MPLMVAKRRLLVDDGAEMGIRVNLSQSQIGAGMLPHTCSTSLMQTMCSQKALESIFSMERNALEEWLKSINSDTYQDVLDNLQCFDPNAWLNSTAINTFLGLLQSQQSPMSVLCFNSFFVSRICDDDGINGVKRWTIMREQFALKDLLVLPVHITEQNAVSTKLEGVHWAIAVAQPKVHKLTYYDSMGASESKNGATAQKIAQFLTAKGRQYTNDLALCSETWKIEFIGPPFIPEQTDHKSCGKFICAFAGLLCAGKPLQNSFVQEDLNLFGFEMKNIFRKVASSARA
jgi:Ulp1 family protease